ncbi:MAG: S9 family peptidase [Fimbriimonadaceae bacterium]
MLATGALAALLLCSAQGEARIGDASPQRVAESELSPYLDAVQFVGRHPIELSPGGDYVAFCVKREVPADRPLNTGRGAFTPEGVPFETYMNRLAIASTRDGTIWFPVSDQFASYAPRWSPDGKRLLFISNQSGVPRLYLLRMEDRSVRQIGEVQPKAYFGFTVPEWSPDGLSLLVHAASSTTKAEIPVALDRRIRVYRSGMGDPHPAQEVATASISGSDRTGDIAIVDVDTGYAQTIARDVSSACARFSPDGRFVAYHKGVGYLPNSQQSVSDLVLYDRDGATTRVVASSVRMNYGTTWSWSPNSKWIAYIETGHSGPGVPVRAAPLALYDVATSQTRYAQNRDGERVNFGTDLYRAPAWTLDSRSVFVNGHGGLWRCDPITGIANLFAGGAAHELAADRAGRIYEPENGFVSVVKDDVVQPLPVLGGAVPANEGPSKSIPLSTRYWAYYSTDVDPISGTLAWVRSTASEPEEIWVQTPAGPPRRLTSFNNALLALEVPKARMVEWTSSDGVPRRGVILEPTTKATQPWPVVTIVYPGRSWTSMVGRYGIEDLGTLNTYLWCRRGYAVFLPEAPVPLIDPVKALVEVVESGIDHQVREGRFDPNRIGVMGHSHGGYAALALAAGSPKFAAVISRAGRSNLISGYGAFSEGRDNTGFYEEGQGAMGTHPWADRDRYIRNSPWFHMDRVTAPVLLIHGSMDTAVPAQAAGESFVALRRLGKVAELVIYEDEDHAETTWVRPHRLDFLQRIIAWFDRYVMTRTQAPTRP